MGDELKGCPFCGLAQRGAINALEYENKFLADRLRCSQKDWSAAAARAATAEQLVERYGVFVQECGFLADIEVYSPDDLPSISERLGAFRARAEAAEQRAEAAEAEAERLRSAIAETLRLADIYAGVAVHNAEAEPETAGEAWRSPYMATVRELRRALGGVA